MLRVMCNHICTQVPFLKFLVSFNNLFLFQEFQQEPVQYLLVKSQISQLYEKVSQLRCFLVHCLHKVRQFEESPDRKAFHLHHCQKISTATKVLAQKHDALDYRLKTSKALRV